MTEYGVGSDSHTLRSSHTIECCNIAITKWKTAMWQFLNEILLLSNEILQYCSFQMKSSNVIIIKWNAEILQLPNERLQLSNQMLQYCNYPMKCCNIAITRWKASMWLLSNKTLQLSNKCCNASQSPVSLDQWPEVNCSCLIEIQLMQQ